MASREIRWLSTLRVWARMSEVFDSVDMAVSNTFAVLREVVGLVALSDTWFAVLAGFVTRVRAGAVTQNAADRKSVV